MAGGRVTEIEEQALNFQSFSCRALPVFFCCNLSCLLRKEDRYTRIKNLIMLLKKPPAEDKGSKSSGGAGASTQITSKEDTRESREDESVLSSHH